MRILILGGSGMLGHQLYKHFKCSCHETKITLHQSYDKYKKFSLFDVSDTYDNVDVLNTEQLSSLFVDFKPDAIINVVGLIKQRPNKLDVLKNLQINSVFPHMLSEMGKEYNARVIHMSTDCVFNGRQGGYKEDDISNAEDIYGRTKYLGELHEPHTFTIRTSIIGFELSHKQSFLEWVLAQEGQVRGYTKAIYNGFTTNEMARIIEKILVEHPIKYGLYQISSHLINKYNLLLVIKKAFNLNIEVLPYDNFECYRDLNSERFQKEFNYIPPSWEVMINELADKNIYAGV